MDPRVIALVIVLAIAVAVLVVALRAGRARRTPVAGTEAAPLPVLPRSEELESANEPSVDLETVMADAGAALYIPVDAGQKYLAVARPEARIEGRTSSIPSQLAGAAVAGQAGLEAMVKAGQLTARLVVVDAKTAEAIKAGTMVTDKAGDMLAIIRGSGSKWSGITRIKPLSGGMVKSASAGPAMLSAIAMQAQLAQVEKSIGEVRDVVDAVKGYLDAAEQASVEGRRETLATGYRTAQESGQMTQSLWDQIQDLEASLRRDVKLADRALEQRVAELEVGASGLVSSRLTWLQAAGGPLASAVAGVADARRSLIQFSVLRLWWLAVIEDPTLASRQTQLAELLAELPDHADERIRTEHVLTAAGILKTYQRVLAPRKHKELAQKVQDAQLDMQGLPWQTLDVRPAVPPEALPASRETAP